MMALSSPTGSTRGHTRFERVATHEAATLHAGDKVDLDEPLARVFDAAAASRPDQQFVVSTVRPDEAYTNAEFAEEARAVARGLVELGVAPGDRVAIWCANRPRWCAAYAAVLFAGAIVVPLDAELGPQHLGTVLADAGAGAIFTGGAGVESAREALPESIAVLSLDETGAVPWGSLRERGAGIELPELQGGDVPAAILYTSGTTGTPKGVVLTHRNMLAEIRGLHVAAYICSGDVLLMLLPLHHLLAQLGSFVLASAFEAKVIDVEARDGNELLAAMREHGVTVLLAVPLLLHLIHDRIDKRVAARPWLTRTLARALMRSNGLMRHLRVNAGPLLFREAHKALGPALRLIVSGGSALDPRAERDLYRLGFTILQAYGLTETCGAATVTAIHDATVGSVGYPIAGVGVRINEPDADGIGEVLLRGAIVTPGYYGMPKATDELIRGDWLYTGDLGRLDRRGRLWITGRSKDVIVLGSGKNVYPVEVENHYVTAPHVKEICVISQRREHGPDRTEKLHAVVVPDWDRLTEDGITSVRGQIHYELEGLSLELPAWQRVLTFELRREPMPRTPTRKVRRFQVAAEARGAEGPTDETPPDDEPEAAARLHSPVGATLCALIEDRVGKIEVLRAASSLELDLGLDSLNRMELLLTLEQRLGVSIADEEAERLTTVDDLLRLLDSKAAGTSTGSEGQSSWQVLVEGADDSDLPDWVTREQPWLMRVVGAVLIGALHLLARTYFRLRVEGREHLPTQGPYLVCPNHESFLDGGVLMAALPAAVRRQTFALGEADHMGTWWGRVLCRVFRVVPTDANRALRSSMRAAAAALKRDKVLIIFPEGTRSPDGTLKELKQGSAILARELGLSLIPVGIEGAFESWPRGQIWPRPGAIRVRFGAALVAGEISADDTEAYAQLTAQLADRLRGLNETTATPDKRRNGT